MGVRSRGINAAGSLYVGPGWDGACVALDLYLDDVAADDLVATPATFAPQSDEDLTC
jgi:hypothetical protein